MVKVVKEQKLLGTVIQNDLKWDSNTSKLVKSANARMRLFHKLSEFDAYLVAIYNSYIKSTLEQNAVVWQNKTVRIKKGCNYLQIYKTKYTVVRCLLR